MGSSVRPIVQQSWARCEAAGLPIGAQTPVVLTASTLADLRDGHLLAPAMPTIQDVLGPAAQDCDAVLAIFDNLGQLLWSTGSHAALRRAEGIGFVEGSLWDERMAGTNAPGMALALDGCVQVAGEEHYREDVKRFGCVAAPIHDPSGAVAGVVDLTGSPSIIGPQMMAAVRATARLAESLLTSAALSNAASSGAMAPRQPQIRLQALGRDRAILSRPVGNTGRYEDLELSPRHSEILVLLVEHPRGLTGDELAVCLYPDDVGASTLRAELNRLKVLLGDSVLASRPYRLLTDLATDWRPHLSGAAEEAPAGTSSEVNYPGPLLPRSAAPGIEELRGRVRFAVRQRVLDSADPALIARWTAVPGEADDYDVWAAQASLSPPGSALHSMARGQLARLDAELL